MKKEMKQLENQLIASKLYVEATEGKLQAMRNLKALTESKFISDLNKDLGLEYTNMIIGNLSEQIHNAYNIKIKIAEQKLSDKFKPVTR